MTSNSPDIFSIGRTVLKCARHGYFLFSRNDQFIGRSLDLYGERCEPEITVALSNLVSATGLVIALEVQRQVCNYLVANFTINNLLHVVCMDNAAGAIAGAEPDNFH